MEVHQIRAEVVSKDDGGDNDLRVRRFKTTPREARLSMANRLRQATTRGAALQQISEKPLAAMERQTKVAPPEAMVLGHPGGIHPVQCVKTCQRERTTRG